MATGTALNFQHYSEYVLKEFECIDNLCNPIPLIVFKSLVYLIKQKLSRYNLVTVLNFQQVILVTNRP